MMNKIKIGDEVTDGFEDGVVVAIRQDGGDVWLSVYDGKEAWEMHEREAKLKDYPNGPITEGDKRLLEQDHSLSACGDQ